MLFYIVLILNNILNVSIKSNSLKFKLLLTNPTFFKFDFYNLHKFKKKVFVFGLKYEIKNVNRRSET